MKNIRFISKENETPNPLTTDPKKAVEFVRSQYEQERKRLLDVMTDEEYKTYKQGK